VGAGDIGLNVKERIKEGHNLAEMFILFFKFAALRFFEPQKSFLVEVGLIGK
jgi:hypothetical protein